MSITHVLSVLLAQFLPKPKGYENASYYHVMLEYLAISPVSLSESLEAFGAVSARALSVPAFGLITYLARHSWPQSNLFWRLLCSLSASFGLVKAAT